MARTKAAARDADTMPRLAAKTLKKAGAAQRRSERSKRAQARTEKRAQAREAKKKQSKALREIPKNSQNHSEFIKGIINILRNHKR